MKNNNIKVGIDVDTTELKQTLDLTRKLKYELSEVNKQLKNISKLGATKRQLKKLFKKWIKSI